MRPQENGGNGRNNKSGDYLSLSFRRLVQTTKLFSFAACRFGRLFRPPLLKASVKPRLRTILFSSRDGEAFYNHPCKPASISVVLTLSQISVTSAPYWTLQTSLSLQLGPYTSRSSSLPSFQRGQTKRQVDFSVDVNLGPDSDSKQQVDEIKPCPCARRVGPDPCGRKPDGRLHGHCRQRAVDPTAPGHDGEGAEHRHRKGGQPPRSRGRGCRRLGGERQGKEQMPETQGAIRALCLKTERQGRPTH